MYNNATNTITWDVANTNAAPYNVANVKIEYTTDLANGTTWTELVASTSNTGSYTLQMPSNLTGAVKLKISAIGNIFYAVSPQVTIGTAPTSTTAAPTGIAALNAEITKTTARLSWNSVPGATYSIQYRKVGQTNWSGTTSALNSVLLTGLEDESDYEAQVAAVVNTVVGTFSSNYTFKTKGLKTGVDYCLMATGGNSFATFAYNSGLAQFVLSNLSYSELYYSTIFSTYRDFTEDATKLINLTKGTQYTFSYFNVGTTTSSYEDNMEVWIDFNRNGVFETSEKVGSVSTDPPASGQYTGSFTFTVPTTAYSGDKLLRMRVANSFFNTASGPCDSPFVPTSGGGVISRGSSKDFAVKISESNLAVDEIKGTKSEISIYPNPADTYIEFKNLKGKGEYKIYTADGRLAQAGNTEGQRIDVSGLVKGVYVVTVKTDSGTLNTKFIKK